MDDLDRRYRVKTNRGYYFTEGRGYGRFHGQALQADVMCEKHAKEVVRLIGDAFKKAGHDIGMEIEDYPGHASCKVCKRVG